MTASPRLAAAQESVPPIEAPSGNLLDRADGVNRIGLAIGWPFLNDNDAVDFEAFRFDLHGQWLAPTAIGRVGGYAILPVSYARLDPDVGATNAEWVVANGELGGVFRRSLVPELDLAAHVGVTLPFARQGTLSSTEITGFANEFAIYARPNDLVHAYPEATYLRLGVSPMYQSADSVFARVDAAVDVPLRSGVGDDLPTIGRLNGAVGAWIGHSVAMLEIVNLIALEEPEGESDRLLTFIGLTGVFGKQRRWQVVPSLLLPLDDEINDAADLVFILGVQVPLP